MLAPLAQPAATDGEVYERAAGYVDKILRGAKPADLPIELPREFQLALNTRTARALGVEVQPDVAARVTEWIQ